MISKAVATASCLCLFASVVEQSVRAQQVPLAYVRRVVIPPIALSMPPDPPLPPAPSAADKRRRERWEVRHKARADLVRLRTGVLGPIWDAVAAQMARVPGLTVAPLPQWMPNSE